MQGLETAEKTVIQGEGAGGFPEESSVHVLSFLEANTLTGQARTLIDFATSANALKPGPGRLPTVRTSIATFHRSRGNGCQPGVAPNAFVQAARSVGLKVDIITERRRYDHNVLRSIRRLVRERAPDIIETHNVKSHFLVRLAGLHRRCPWVAFHEGYTATDLKDRAYNQLNRWSLRAVDVVITMCRPFAEMLAQQGVDLARIRVLHNAVDPDATYAVSAEDTAAARKAIGPRPGEHLILSVGRLSSEKGHADLIEAFALLCRWRPDVRVRLVFLGDGPERRRLEARCRTLGVAKQVMFVGHVPEPRPYYTLADVFVLPSHSEGSPVVLLEAMATGLPIATTAVGGVPEIVADGENALLVLSHHPVAMCRALERLLKDADLAIRLGASARSAVQYRFSPERRRDTLLGIYREALSARGMPG